MARFFEDNNCEITRKWWHFATKEINKHPLYVEEDIKAIKECDLFVMYNSKKKTGGKYIELGIAIALNKPVLIYGIHITSVFKTRTCYCGEFNINT